VQGSCDHTAASSVTKFPTARAIRTDSVGSSNLPAASRQHSEMKAKNRASGALADAVSTRSSASRNVLTASSSSTAPAPPRIRLAAFTADLCAWALACSSAKSAPNDAIASCRCWAATVTPGSSEQSSPNAKILSRNCKLCAGMSGKEATADRLVLQTKAIVNKERRDAKMPDARIGAARVSGGKNIT